MAGEIRVLLVVDEPDVAEMIATSIGRESVTFVTDYENLIEEDATLLDVSIRPVRGPSGDVETDIADAG